MAHTPGRWHAVEWHIDSNKPSCFSVMFHCERGLADLREIERNALLLQAAPELLTAAIEWMEDPLGDPNPLRSAIAKAQGKL